MTVEEFRTQLHEQPFRPFVIHLADGRQIPVHRPDFVALALSDRTITVYQPDDSSNVVDLLLVRDLERRPNGASKPQQS